MNPFWELETFGTSTAIVLPDGYEVSYAQLARMADDTVADWPTASLVFVHCRNRLPSLATYLGALRNGHVAMLLPPNLPAPSLQSLLAAYAPDVQVLSDGEQLLFENDRPTVIDRRVAVLLSTSGSTGGAKQVALSRDNLDSNAGAIADYLELTNSERPITTLPMHYSFGMSVINSHLAVGARMLLTEDTLVSQPFWDFFRIAEATSLAGVPTSYELLERLHIERMDLPSLHLLIQAGGRLPVERATHFAQLAKSKGWRFYIMYGQTEASPRIAYLPDGEALAYPEYIGHAIPGGRLRLIDGDNNEIGDTGVEGELVYQGPNVMLGYACSRPDLATLQPPTELRTGDLAVLNDAGYYRITGRLARFIKLDGQRVALDDVEARLAKSGFMVHCCGADNHLVIAHQPDTDAARVTQTLVDELGLPHRYLFPTEVATWPLTTNGKIDYARLDAACDRA